MITDPVKNAHCSIQCPKQLVTYRCSLTRCRVGVAAVVASTAAAAPKAAAAAAAAVAPRPLRPCACRPLRRAAHIAAAAAAGNGSSSPFDLLRAAFGGGKGGGGNDQNQNNDGKEEEDENTVVPLGGSRTPAGTEELFGATAVLLVGYSRDEMDAVRALLDDMGASMVPVVPANRAMMGGTIRAAVEARPPLPHEPPPIGRRAVILSGLYTEELIDVIGAYKDAGLPPTVFSAAVPGNYDNRSIADVVEACWKDQMAAQRRGLLADE